MEKKHVSIVGCCVSREMFNDPRMKEIFDIDLYAFKVCPWALFDETLNIPEELIQKAPNKEFLNRMLDYEFNRKTIFNLKNIKSEFIFIDLFCMVEKVFRVTYKNKSAFIQADGKYVLNGFVRSLGEKAKDFQFCELNLKDIDKNIVLDGLDKFAHFVNENYKKAVVIWPTFAKQYIAFDGTIKDYKSDSSELKKCVDYYTKYFISKLKNAITLKWKEDFKARVHYNDFKFISKPDFEPYQVHLLEENFESVVSSLLLKLRINYKDYYTLPLDYKSFKTEKLALEISKMAPLLEKMQSDVICGIQAYTNFLSTLNHHLIIITANDDASKRLKYYYNRNILKIKFNIKFRESFVAIIDTKNDFRTEKSSPNTIEMIYEIPNTDTKIDIVSKGFKAGCHSSVQFNGQEMSKNKRGLNFFVLDLDTMEVVDRASCDLYGDEFLLMDSDYFSATKSRK